MNYTQRFLVVLFILMVVAGCSANKELSVTNAWARPGTTGSNSAIYFTVANPIAEDDYLIRASTDAARVVEMHLSTQNESGMMMMMPQENILIPAKGSLEFKPGSYHIMLINLINDLDAGSTISLELQFEKAGIIELNVPVKEE